VTYKVDPEAQEAVATARFIRMSATKARLVVDLIRGRHIDDARRVLQFTARGASSPVAKVLESAIANAENNRELPGDELVVAKAWVDEGPTLKRFRPRALGRATRIRKRTCHISVVVARDQSLVEEIAPPAPAEEEKPKGKRSAKKETGRAAGPKRRAQKDKRGPRDEEKATQSETGETPNEEEAE
jgi:large subunit ribosomal protein L22